MWLFLTHAVAPRRPSLTGRPLLTGRLILPVRAVPHGWPPLTGRESVLMTGSVHPVAQDVAGKVLEVSILQ